jgi:hypothetical protein
MTYRMLAASLVVLAGAGWMFAPAGAGTATGAFVGARSFQGGFHASAPAFAHKGAPMAAHRFVAQRGAFFFRGREHREGEFRRWAGFGGYFPYDYPAGYPASYDAPSYPYPYAYPDAPTAERYMTRLPLHCSTDSQSVPSEKGGVTTINVTRCY